MLREIDETHFLCAKISTQPNHKNEHLRLGRKMQDFDVMRIPENSYLHTEIASLRVLNIDDFTKVLNVGEIGFLPEAVENQLREKLTDI